MVDVKQCTQCEKYKNIPDDFYLLKGKFRAACKQCIIKSNIKYQQKTVYWKHKIVNAERRREYLLKYYAKNKEKYAQYRKTFKEKFPTYFCEYARNKKNNKKGY